jgi:hypothetical protein
LQQTFGQQGNGLAHKAVKALPGIVFSNAKLFHRAIIIIQNAPLVNARLCSGRILHGDHDDFPSEFSVNTGDVSADP